MIDLHAHVVLESTLGAAGPLGPELIEGDPDTGTPPRFRVGTYELVGITYRDSPFMDLGLRLAAMEAHGITYQLLSPNPLTYFSHVDPVFATQYAQRHNDELGALVATQPGRLGGLAQLPTQDPQAACIELTRAVTDLGLLGASIGSDLGAPLDDPRFDELWSTFEALDVPAFIHPAPDGIDRPRRDERLGRFDGDLWLGFLYEESLAVASLVFGGVLDRHRRLDCCISHGGGATAWMLERLTHAAQTRPWGRPRFEEPGEFRALLGRLWWDAHVGGPQSLRTLIDAFGDTRVVGGSNFAGWDQQTDLTHGDSELATRLDRNARRLLRL